jgi:hypothetical protein
MGSCSPVVSMRTLIGRLVFVKWVESGPNSGRPAYGFVETPDGRRLFVHPAIALASLETAAAVCNLSRWRTRKV